MSEKWEGKAQIWKAALLSGALAQLTLLSLILLLIFEEDEWLSLLIYQKFCKPKLKAILPSLYLYSTSDHGCTKSTMLPCQNWSNQTSPKALKSSVYSLVTLGFYWVIGLWLHLWYHHLWMMISFHLCVLRRGNLLPQLLANSCLLTFWLSFSRSCLILETDLMKKSTASLGKTLTFILAKRGQKNGNTTERQIENEIE